MLINIWTKTIFRDVLSEDVIIDNGKDYRCKDFAVGEK
jgi:hypothetical protein